MNAQELIREGAAVLGLLLMFVGLWNVYWPAALIVTGALLLLASVYGHLHPPQSPRSPDDGDRIETT